MPQQPATDIPSMQSHPAPTNDHSAPTSWETRWIIVFLVLGLAIRALRYLLKFPIWGDEALLCINFFDRDYAGLIRPLDAHQVAPLLFLWVELTSIKLLGFNEWSLRLFPFLCSLASVAVFYWIARRTLQGLGLVLAVGFFCVSYAGVRYASEVKPYGCDLFFSTVLLALALRSLQEPRAARWLWFLTAIMPLALGLSYPAVFVAGGVSLATAVALLRAPTVRTWIAWTSYNAALVASFTFYFFVAAQGQGAAEKHVMAQLWGYAFPPSGSIVEFAKWFVVVNTGPVFAQPVGGDHYGSAATTAVFLVGVAVWLRRRQYPLLVLCLVPFGLNFLAAALHRYPYGGHVRLAMHLMPIVCLSAGLGAATVLQKVASLEVWRRLPVCLRWRRIPIEAGMATVSWKPVATVVCTALVVLGLGLVSRDIYRPGKEWQEIRKRDFANWFWGSMARDHELVCMMTDLHVSFAEPGCPWHNYVSPTYLCNERIYSPRVARGEKPNFERASRERPLAFVQYYSHWNPYDKAAFDAWFRKTSEKYEYVATHRFPLPQDNDTDKVLNATDYIEMYEFVPREVAKPRASGNVEQMATKAAGVVR